MIRCCPLPRTSAPSPTGTGKRTTGLTFFLAGSGLFPTSGAVKPTFTLTAQALRTMQYGIARWGNYS